MELHNGYILKKTREVNISTPTADELAQTNPRDRWGASGDLAPLADLALVLLGEAGPG